MSARISSRSSTKRAPRHDRPDIAGRGEAAHELDVEARDDAARPRRHDHDCRAEKQCLLDRMGDEEDLLAGLRPDPRRAAAAWSRASGCRARRTARPSAGFWDRSPAPARCRRAGACRPKARRAACPRNPPSPTRRSSSRARSRRSRFGMPLYLRPSATLSSTDAQGSSVSFWKTTPRSPPGPSIACHPA